MSEPRIAAIALVFDDDGRVLLTRREDNGLWCIPGGHVEFGETVAETAVRELREETGLDVELGRPVGIYSRHPWALAQGRQIVVLAFLADVVGGALRLSAETTETGWFAPDRLPHDLMPPHYERIADAVAVREGAPFFVR